MTSFQKGNTGPLLEYPLMEVPPDDGTSMLASPMVGECYGLTPLTGDRLRDAMHEVMRVRMDVAQGVWPSWFFENHGVNPDVPGPLQDHVFGLGEPDPEKAAQLVRMDQPTDLGRILVIWLLDNGAGWKCDDTEPHEPFLDKQPAFYDLLGHNVNEALRAAFSAKWFYGAVRPEEYFGFNMTAYNEGSPTHPGLPAGHGAAAGATHATIAQSLILSDGQADIVRDTCLHFAHYRTLSGVHTAYDNESGYQLGLKTILG